jgi:hypothetical protein
MSMQTGNLYGTVTDDKGAPLPGVGVVITRVGAPQVQVTNAQGQFQFLSLQPDIYSFEAQLEGFKSYEIPKINIQTGRNTTLAITLRPSIE